MTNKAAFLRHLFRTKPIIQVMGAHDGLGAKLAEKNGFDAVWASGLEISASYAVPDANILTMTENLQAATVIHEATTLPVICDCDTGFGNALNASYMVRKYEAAGIAAVVIEDKLFPKVNSFIPGRQELASIPEFMGKLEAAKNAQKTPDFMVLARIEALIAGWGMEEALRRADAYAEAGADGLVVHSKAATPDEIYDFVAKWRGNLPVIVIPTTYPSVTADELARKKIKMVIYANHGLRASIKAMNEVLSQIHQSGCTAGVEGRIASMREVFELQGMGRYKEEEKRFSRKDAAQAVITAAGDHRGHSDFSKIIQQAPVCMLPIGGKTLLDRQLDTLRSCGISDIYVVGGYSVSSIKADGATLLTNLDYADTGVVKTLEAANQKIKERFLMCYSDIIFDRTIADHLLDSPYEITVVMDRAYTTHPSRLKKLDLVVAGSTKNPAGSRNLTHSLYKPVLKIGRSLPNTEAVTHEFIGMVYFREEGWNWFQDAWGKAQDAFKSKPFYDARSVEKADITDMIQYLIDLGRPVHGMEIEHGWSELHSMEDYDRVNHFFGETLSPKTPT